MRRKVFTLRAISIISVVGFLFYPINFFSFLVPDKGIQDISIFEAVITSIFIYAWFSWFVMAIAWLFDKKLSRYWPISGSISGTLGVLCVLPLVVPALLLLPSIILAITFCRFHLKRDLRECLQ
jgi:uncharacterized protein YacL